MDWNPEHWKQTWPHYSLPANRLARAAMAESFAEKVVPGVDWTVSAPGREPETWRVGSLDQAKLMQRLTGLWAEPRPHLLSASDGSFSAYFNGVDELWIR